MSERLTANDRIRGVSNETKDRLRAACGQTTLQYAEHGESVCLFSTGLDGDIMPSFEDPELVAAIGQALKEAGQPYMEFGLAQWDGDKVGSYRGSSFRITAGGKMIFPDIRWPEDNAWRCSVCAEAGVNISVIHSYDAMVNVGIPVCPFDHDMEPVDTDDKEAVAAFYSNLDDPSFCDNDTEYVDIEDCKASGKHLQDCDEDGYCDRCGEQE